MARKKLQTPQKGDYFKGRVGKTLLTGKVGVRLDWWADKDDEDYVPDLVALHNLDDLGSDEAQDYEGFKEATEICRIGDYQKITKREYNSLSKKVEYNGISNYSFQVLKNKKDPEEDTFKFGCGSIEVQRKYVRLLLTLTKLGIIDDLPKITYLIEDIKDYSKDAITESNLKQLLKL